MNVLRTSLALLVAFSVASCSDDTSPSSSNQGGDASIDASDASSDASPPEAGPDASPEDAANDVLPGDTGTDVTDSSVPDAPPADAGLSDLPPLDKGNVVHMTDTDVRVQPSLALASDKTMVITWTGKDNDSLGIFAQVFDLSGAKLQVKQPRFRVNTDTRGVSNEPSVCAMGTHGFVVVWSQDTKETGTDNLQIRLRTLAADGTPTGSADVRVLTNRPGNHWLAEVACAAGGGFWVTGVRPGEGNGGFEVFARKYDVTATKPEAAMTVQKVATGGGQGFPDVGLGPKGQVVVAYEDSEATGPKRVKARRWDGTAWGTANIVAGGATDAMSPAVAVDPVTGSYLVAGGTNAGLVVRRYEGDKEVMQVGLPDTGLTASAAIASVGKDRFALGYFVGNGNPASVRVGYVDATGHMTAPTGYVATGKFPLAYRPAVAFGGGLLAAAWTESKGGGKYAISFAVFGM